MRPWMVAIVIFCAFVFTPSRLLSADSGMGSTHGCQDSEPVLTLAIAAHQHAGAIEPMYLPLSATRNNLLPGIRLHLMWIPLANGQVVYKTFFDFDRDLLSTDYSIYRLNYTIFDGSRMISSNNIDYSNHCLNPAGRQVRAGETLYAAKFSINPAIYSHPRIRITVWAGMF